EIIAVNKGGTGTKNLTGYVKANGNLAMNASATIPSTDVTGLITKVNGSLPDATGNVSVILGDVSTGTLTDRPSSPGTNGNIYVVSGDVAADNGRTYISDGTNWNEVTTNQSATDARYLQLAGGTLSGDIVVPAGNTITLTYIPSDGTDATNKIYVDNALALKATIASPSFSGIPTAPTAGDGTSTLQVATTEFVGISVGAGVADEINDQTTAVAPSQNAVFDGLALKEDAANKSVEASLGDSDVLYPSQKAVKTYVDATVASGAPDATLSSKGLIQLTGDLGGTSDNPRVPGLADKMSYPSAAGSNGEVLTTDGSNGLAWAASTDDQTAAEVSSSAVGNIIAEDVDAAIAELEAEKLALAGGTMTGDLLGTNASEGATSATSKISGFAATLNAITGTSYSLTAADNGKVITLSNSSAITLTVPSLFPGFNCLIIQLGAGQVTLATQSTTISNRNSHTKTAGQHAILTLVAITNDAFISSGDMSSS
ncbi:hypothetical protein N8385_07780, partial [Cyclobacteriaceae bacterium]|nr:hypothetical protein [Cyclobacteriaceae bacterium]